MLDALFDKVREDFLKNQPSACGLPVEFSLTSSLLPLCVNSAEDNEGLCVIELIFSVTSNSHLWLHVVMTLLII